MKYIRTKEGIFDIEKSSEYGVLTLTKIFDKEYYDKLGLKEGDKYVTINHQDIKITENNVSDTIEELCDEFVADNELLVFEDITRYAMYKNYTIYGAIWTDKGLIFVAKMNDKGVLELL